MKENSQIPINETTIAPLAKTNSMPIPSYPQTKIEPNQSNQTTEDSGFFSNLWKKLKSSWTIEEEEYIDAHGFKAKRPKNKIPLRSKEQSYNSQAQFEGTSALGTASQYSPFGRMFL